MASPPNILLVIADDHRADAIGGLGHSAVVTPTLDELAWQGSVFSRTRIMGGLMPAVCAPSRACLFTGRNVFRADAEPGLAFGPHNEVKLPADAPTLPEVFRSAGYETFFTGKWHNDVPALLRSFENGRAIFHGGMSSHTAVPVRDLADFRSGAPARIGGGFSTDLFADAAEHFLRTRERRRPFFACLSFTSPHDPRTPPPEFRRLYPPDRIALPANFEPQHPFDNGSLEIRDERLSPRPLSQAAIREELAAYYGMISHHDAALGRVLRALADAGDAKTTIVVYLSDHGLALGSHGLLGKQNLYECSVRVPLLLRGPGIPVGAQFRALAYAFDLYATLCELTGLALPRGTDSRSLAPVLRGEGANGRSEICAVYMDQQRMVTDGRWKLILYRAKGSERVQLFDLDDDGDERANLAESHRHRHHVQRLRKRLASWQREAGDRWWQD